MSARCDPKHGLWLYVVCAVVLYYIVYCGAMLYIDLVEEDGDEGDECNGTMYS